MAVAEPSSLSGLVASTARRGDELTVLDASEAVGADLEAIGLPVPSPGPAIPSAIGGGPPSPGPDIDGMTAFVGVDNPAQG